MALSAKPGCIIQLTLATPRAVGTDIPRVGVRVTATCNTSPLFVQQVDGSWAQQASPTVIETHTNAAGVALLTVPPYTDCDPQVVDDQGTPPTWTISEDDDGTTLAGHVTPEMVTATLPDPITGVVTPLTPRVLRDTYSWKVPVTVGQVVTVPPDLSALLLARLGY